MAQAAQLTVHKMDDSAGIAGLLSQSIHASQTLGEFYTNVVSPGSEIVSITHKLDRLTDIAKSVKAHWAGRKSEDDEKDLQLIVKDLIKDHRDCIDELDTVCNKVVTCSESDSFVRRRSFPFRISTISTIEKNVDSATPVLALIFQAFQAYDNENTSDDLANNNNLLKLLQARQVLSNIRGWLKAPDVSIDYNMFSKKKYAGTGLWLTECKEFANWLVKPNSFLLLYGPAGCGKSVLCTTAIQHTLKHRKSNPRIGLAFFYFKFNDMEKQSASAMLRALILQLSSQSSDTYDRLTSLHKKYLNATPSDQELIDCLQQIVRAFEEVYILLDALDESPRDKDLNDLLQALVNIRSWSENGLHLLVTSRDEYDKLHTLPEEKISISRHMNDYNIGLYISGALATNRRLKKWLPYHDLIKDALTERAQGIFLWVEFQLIALAACPRSKSKLDRLLASLPRSLDETYARILNGVDDDAVHDVRRILMLLCCAIHTMTVAEVIDALAVQLGDNPQFEPSARLCGEDDLLQLCPGYIKIDGEKDTENAGQRQVRIAHLTIQEYLESERIHYEPRLSRFGVNRSKMRKEVANICLAYLDYADGDIDSPRFPFACYAAYTWSSYYQSMVQGR